jgi:hypothetical protein
MSLDPPVPAFDPERLFFKTIIDMVVQDCMIRTVGDPFDEPLDSWAIGAHARAMRLLAEAGFIVIDAEVDRRVCGRLRPEGRVPWEQEP